MKITLGQHPKIQQLDQIATTFEELGVEVVRLPSATTDAVFHRDVAAWTPFGHIQCRMGKASRAWEPSVWLDAVGINPRLVIQSPNTFEGADLLWVDPYLALIGIGSRTNVGGAKAVLEFLSSYGVVTILVTLPLWHKQHLLGLANAVKGQLYGYGVICKQTQCFDPIKINQQGYSQKAINWVELPASGLAVNKHAVQWLAKPCKRMQVVPLSIEGLLQYEGGLACAIGVLNSTLTAHKKSPQPKLGA